MALLSQVINLYPSSESTAELTNDGELFVCLSVLMIRGLVGEKG